MDDSGNEVASTWDKIDTIMFKALQEDQRTSFMWFVDMVQTNKLSDRFDEKEFKISVKGYSF